MKLKARIVKDYRILYKLLSRKTVFVALDTETTGLKPEDCRIIELACVKFNVDGIIEKFNTLINPKIPIPAEITKITNITDKMLKDAPTFSQICGEFEKFVENTTIIGHNVQFDLRFIKAEMERLNKDEINNFTIDTLRLCKWAYPNLKHYKQIEMARYLNIPVNAAHRAHDDAFVCGNIFLQCIKDTMNMQKGAN